MSIKDIYEKRDGMMLAIPLIILFLAFIQIGYQSYSTGDFVSKGVSLKGGSTITLARSGDISDVNNFFGENFKDIEYTVRSIGRAEGVTIESSLQKSDDIKYAKNLLKDRFNLDDDDITIQITGSSIGRSFFKETIFSLIIAFILMGFVVFIYFRTPVPSLAVMLAALSDMVITLAIFNLSGMRLSSAGVAAFLMLIGYSVDTDILLTTRILKRKELSLDKRVYSAMKTGLTMTSTTLAAIIVSLFVVKSDVISQIMIILFIGITVDIMNTWMQNVAILRIYAKRKDR